MGCSVRSSLHHPHCAVNYDNKNSVSNFTMNQTDTTVWKLVPNTTAAAWMLQGTWTTSPSPVLTLCHGCARKSSAIASSQNLFYTINNVTHTDMNLGFNTFQSSIESVIATNRDSAKYLSPSATDDVGCVLLKVFSTNENGVASHFAILCHFARVLLSVQQCHPNGDLCTR